MPAAQLAVQVAALGQWKLHAGIHDPALADDHAQVVQGRIGPENCIEHRGRQIGVDAGAAFGNTAQANLALDGNQSADFAAGEKKGGFNQCFNIFIELDREAAEEARLAQSHQGAADFGLEHDDGGEGCEEQELAVKEIDPVQVQFRADQSDDQVEDHQQQAGPLDHALAAGAAQKAHDRKDHQADDQQLNADLPPAVDTDGLPEIDQVEEFVIHPTARLPHARRTPLQLYKCSGRSATRG